MKKFQIIAIFLVVSLLFVGGCQQGLKNYFQSPMKMNVGNANYNYLLYLPDGYSKDTKKNWPMIFYLHGASHRGNDLNRLKKYGIPNLIEKGRQFEFIVVSPQCPKGKRWNTDNWFEPLYSYLTQTYKVDEKRVYLTGLSMGGEGTWSLSIKYPDRFAAVVPICGKTSRFKNIRKNAYRIKDLPIWVFHGAADAIVDVNESDKMVQILKTLGSDVKYTRYLYANHSKAHWTAYKNKELYQWFLKHQR